MVGEYPCKDKSVLADCKDTHYPCDPHEGEENNSTLESSPEKN